MAVGFKNIEVTLLPIEAKSIGEKEEVKEVESNQNVSQDEMTRLVVDVRTPGEFMTGAFPDAINIPLDDITAGKADFGTNTSREIIVYCASGARSAYAMQVLQQRGFTNVTNGGGIAAMMARI
jgi:rhodanese-related sulfurtransferase